MKKGKLILFMLLRETAGIGLTLILAYIPGMLIDSILSGDKMLSVGILTAAMAGGGFVCNCVRKYCGDKIDYRFYELKNILDEDSNSKFAHARLDKFEVMQGYRGILGDYINRDCLKRKAEAILAIVSGLCLVAVILTLPPKLPVVFYLSAGALAGIGAGADLLYKRLDRSLRQRFAENQQELSKSIWAMTKSCYAKEIRIYQLKNFTEAKYNEARKKLYDTFDRKNSTGVKLDVLPALAKGAEILTSYGFAAFYFSGGGVTAGMFVICANLMQRYYEGIGAIIKSAITVWDEEKYQREFETFLREDDGYRTDSQKPSLKCNWEIEFCDVAYRYPGSNKEAVKELNLTVRKGDRISLVGENGAGKSTFVRLLTGMYRPTEGKIYVNGVDLEQMNVKDYQRYFTAIYQDVAIFDYSILENITLRAAASEGECPPELAELIEKLGLQDTVDGLEKGVDTMVSRRFDERGVNLSGGERQKLALARAMRKGAEIMVFDEPTSAMSATAEKMMYEIYKSFSEEKTVLFISHRLAGCRAADRILVFRDGSLAQEGVHEELMRDSEGLYYKMFTAQAQNYT